MPSMHTYINSWQHILLLCSLFGALLATAPISSNLDCPYEPLPDSLDTLSGLGFNGELHIHNVYYTEFTRGQNHLITFTVQEESAFRIYIEPHYVDIDIWLYSGTTAVAHTSDYSLADEVVYYNLKPNIQYRIRIYFFGTFTGTCPSMATEISIIPKARLTQRVSSSPCPASQLLPDINTGTLTAAGFSYDSTANVSAVFNVQYPWDTTMSPFIFLKNYTITLPQIDPTGDTWEIEVVLGSHFPTSALGLLLQGADEDMPVDLSCFDTGDCSIAAHNVRGQSTLKTLVLPGTYGLWLYDVPRDRDVNLTSCNPITLSLKITHAQQLEDFLNCDAEPFPTNLNEPGIMDDSGYAYYREDILVDLSVPLNVVKFNVTQPSYFRAFCAAHRIDFDLKLLTASGTVLAYGYQYGTIDEGIQYLLPAGTYSFQLIIFGKYDEVFCETALLELAIAPQTLYSGNDVCTGQNASTPDLSGLYGLVANPTYKMPAGGPYRYVYGGVYSRKVISSITFNVSVDSYIQAQLGSNFILSDIAIWLISYTTSGKTATELGYHRRNMHFLDVFVPGGAPGIPALYTIQIVTAATQAAPSATTFPPCATYSLSLAVVPANATAPLQCLKNRPFPSSLNTPQALDTSPKIHIQEEFLVPKITTLYAVETVTFTVTTPSYFRVYTEPHHIDIDLKLQENATVVDQGTNFNDEEAVSWVVRPGNRYTLTITYYKWYFIEHGNDPCYTFQGELSISPITENILANCSTINTPPTDLGQIVAATPIYQENDYSFNQGVIPSNFKIKFTITVTSIFRAVVAYDFVWNDVALQLETPGSSDPVQGELKYNKNEISATQLTPGNYTLHIYEPFNTTTKNMFALRNCVTFHLTLGIEVVDYNTIDPLLLSCEDQYYPPFWNTPSLLSNLTGNNVDFDQYILADVTDRSDGFVFTVITPSVFRIYIPANTVIDVDVFLLKGSVTIASQVSYGKEELIQAQIAPGTYTVKFSYYGLISTSILPPASDCAAYRVQISIYDKNSLSSVAPLSSSCSTNFSVALDSTIASNSFNFQRSLEQQLYFTSYALFTLRTTYQFTVKFEQNDASTGVAMLLQSGSKTYNPLYFLNHVYLNEYLPSGTYNISFHDPAGKNTIFLCAPYALTYSLTVSNAPADSCPSDVLPSDLSVATGGSVPFGGPQAADGFIHMYGDNFAAPKGTKNKDNYILLLAKTKSYLRLFLDVEDGNSITASLFANTNLTSSAPVYSTIAANTYDRSNIWVLPAQQAPYVLDLYFKTISNNIDCNYFTFELVLEPESTVLGNLGCPSPLPYEIYQLPPETVDVYSQQDYYLSSDQFLVTSQKYFNNLRDGVYSYTMTINVASNSTLTALIAYDFVVNEFALVLKDGSGNNITTGVHQESPATDTGFNFMNYLQWRISPGTYRLVIADVGVKSWNLTTFCHFFSFSLAVSAINYTNPRILQVDPSSGSDMDPSAPLTLVVTFSEPAYVAIPTGYDLTAYLGAFNVAYLKWGALNLTANETFFDSSHSQLTLRFEAPFGDGQTYSLILDYTQFHPVRNTSTNFQAGALTFGHTYIMHRCASSCNHGTCSQVGSSWVCACLPTWAGTSCSQCDTGYHPAGLICVANTYCNTNSCNTHGSCSDAAGYPVCSCRIGFTGTACTMCAPGYINYPNCTLNSTDTDEPDSCTLPLIPSDLNTPAYLSYAGHLHVQGFYYINQNLRQHDTIFTISQQSLFRIYTEPHEIDIDVWLYKVAADGTLTSVTYRISFGLEESILIKLDPANYLIRFRYYMWVVPSSDCVSFDLELAIAPYAAAQAESAGLSYYCGATDNVPNVPSLANVNAPFSFSNQANTVNAPTPSTNTKPNYFYRLNITIVPPSPTQVATLHATLGYRFLQGDLSLLLEAGNTGIHCNNLASTALTPPPGCVYGDNLENANTLHRYLEAGDYILWIYEPVRQIPDVSACSPFDFSLTIDFVDDEQDIFSCNLPQLPLSLDSTQYQENPGYIHFRDFFLLDQRNMSFTVSQQSLLRVAITGVDAAVALYNSDTTSVATNGDSKSILASLAPGKYYLHYTTDMFAFCPFVAVEFALAPANNTISVTCPAYPSVPLISVTSIPFEFAPSRLSPIAPTFVTLNSASSPIVTSYTFRLASTGYLDTGVESDFLRGNLRLEVWNTDWSALVASGFNNYNYNQLQVELEPGNYELRIVLPPGQRVNGIPACIQYNLDLRIYYISTSAPACQSNHLPYSFNTMRFLGYDGKMNYQSDYWRAPSFQISYVQNIIFNVSTPSLMRAYTEPHNIDIDIKLLNAVGLLLVSGSNAIGTEESFTYMLNPGTYTFQIQFYNFGSGPVGPCETFNMEVEIGPIPQRQAICDNSGNAWPQGLTGTLALPYTYNSVDINMPLYYQQISKKAVSYTMSFTLSTAANFHVEIGYDFLVGDLVLKLYSVATKEYFYGANRIDRNVLTLVNIPSGAYQLTIYEATVNLDSVIACSPFTFEVYAEGYSALIDEERFLIEYYLPSSLDTIAYLNASKKVHVANDLFMFDGSGLHENTTFTIKEASLLRVDSLLAESEVSSGHFEAPTVTLYNAGAVVLVGTNGSLLTTLSPGFYMVALTPPSSVTEGDDLGVIVSFQLAINTIAILQQELMQETQSPTCASTSFDAVQTSPAGFYQDGSSLATISYSQLSSSNDIVRLPFVLDRFSFVYLQVGSQFLLSELEVRIYSNTTILHGRIRKNINEIHQGLPAGSYYAYIRQPQIQNPSTLPHCGQFSYSFIIKDANNPGTIIDCSTLNELPWQLDNTTGGSVSYGGPISNDGFLHLYTPNAHIPGQSSSKMSFTLSKATLMSALVVGYPSAFTTIDFTLSNSTGITQTPTQNLATTSDRSRLTQYSLNSNGYALGINYRGSYTIGLCYSFTLQIDIAPATAVQSAVTCPSGITGTPLPTSITLDASNNAYKMIDSFFQGWGSVAGLQQQINFVTTVPSTSVVFTLAFNSLITGFTMKLNSIKTTTTSLVYTAQTRGQVSNYGNTNVYLYISTNIPAGNYSITITHAALVSPFNPPTQVCPPYTFTYTIGQTATISSITPSSADKISSTDPFSIVIAFSYPIYSATKAPITSVNSSAITGAFFLSGNSGRLAPASAVATSVDSLQWLLTFPPLGAQATTFTLSINPGVIFDLAGNPITLLGLNKYTTASCYHGSFKNSVCVCDAGYVGDECKVCASGYVAASDTPGVCVKDQCASSPSLCNPPIGICQTNSSSLAHCACPPAFAGERCELCSATYTNWPTCSKFSTCSPECKNKGTCVDGKCSCVGHFDGTACEKCPSNFDGESCDQCAKGYSGTDCSVYKADGDWGATKTFLEVTGVLVLVALFVGAAFWYWRYRRAGSRYKLVSKFNMEDDDDETGHHFPDRDNRLVDDEEGENPHSQFHEAPEAPEAPEDHPHVELPRGAGSINSAPESFSSSNNPPRLLDM